MGYRKIKPVLMDFAAFVKECSLRIEDEDYFCGYSCGSKSKDKSQRGSCYPFDCPFVLVATLTDLKEHDPSLYEEYQEEYKKLPLDTSVGSYVVQYRECAKRKSPGGRGCQ